jgi:NTP pyrophosphatase (non-canonical NTP hydrolase)
MSNQISLKQLQKELLVWQGHNFPGRKWDKPFMGMVEELGELSHALLKQEQGIRGTSQNHDAAIVDAVADLLVFMADFCNARGINLQTALTDTWAQVRQRDWVRFPKNGKDE